MLGSTGEAVMLSDQERRDVLKSAREAAAPNKVLIAGTGIESAIETLRLTEYAAELGYDVAMVRTPHYYKKQMQPANILAFYRTVADRSPLPVMIYNFPQATGYDIPPELVIELAGASESDWDQGIERRRRKSPQDGGRHATYPAQRYGDGDIRGGYAAHDCVRSLRIQAGTAGNWCGCGFDRESSQGEAFIVSGDHCRQDEDSAERSRISGDGGSGDKAARFAGSRRGRRDSCLRLRWLRLPATRFMPPGKKVMRSWRG